MDASRQKRQRSVDSDEQPGEASSQSEDLSIQNQYYQTFQTLQSQLSRQCIQARRIKRGTTQDPRSLHNPNNQYFLSQLPHLQSQDPMQVVQTLSDICMRLALLTDEQISNFPAEIFIPELIRCIKIQEQPEVVMQAFLCMTHLVDSVVNISPIVAQCGGIPEICQKILNIEYIDTAEHAIKVLSRVALECCSEILQSGGFVGILNMIEFLEIHVQRQAGDCIVSMAKAVNNEADFIEFVGPFIQQAVAHLQFRGSEYYVINEKFIIFFTCLLESIIGFCKGDEEKIEKYFEMVLGATMSDMLNIIMQQEVKSIEYVIKLLRVGTSRSCTFSQIVLEGSIEFILSLTYDSESLCFEIYSLLDCILPRNQSKRLIEVNKKRYLRKNQIIMDKVANQVMHMIFQNFGNIPQKKFKVMSIKVLDKVMALCSADQIEKYVASSNFAVFI